MEFTFLRKDRISHLIYANDFPNSLDQPNVPEKNDIQLPAVWFTKRVPKKPLNFSNYLDLDSNDSKSS